MLKTLITACLLIWLIATTVNADIVAHWPADGNYSDRVHGNDGSPFGDTGFTEGVFGQAFFFGNGGGYVLVPDSDDFDFGTADFSVSFRVNYVRIIFNGSGVIDKDNYSEPSFAQYNGWLFNNAPNTGGIGFETRNIPSAGTYNNRYDPSNFELLTWYNLTATRSKNVTSLYVDSQLVGQVVETIPADVTNSIDLIIGSLAPSGPGAQILHGSVDDVAIYNHALSELEVRRIFLYGVANSSGGLPGDLNLDSTVDLLDVLPFVEILTNGGFQVEADVNLDGAINLLDVQPFVDILTGP